MMASKRSRAYKCKVCVEQGKSTINSRSILIEHVYKTHIANDKQPFYCRLCFFKCQQKKQLFEHVTSFKRHRDLVKEKKIINSAPFLVSNDDPYWVGSQDFIVLSKEESEQWWGIVSRKRWDSHDLLEEKACRNAEIGMEEEAEDVLTVSEAIPEEWRESRQEGSKENSESVAGEAGCSNTVAIQKEKEDFVPGTINEPEGCPSQISAPSVSGQKETNSSSSSSASSSSSCSSCSCSKKADELSNSHMIDVLGSFIEECQRSIIERMKKEIKELRNELNEVRMLLTEQRVGAEVENKGGSERERLDKNGQKQEYNTVEITDGKRQVKMRQDSRAERNDNQMESFERNEERRRKDKERHGTEYMMQERRVRGTESFRDKREHIQEMRDVRGARMREASRDKGQYEGERRANRGKLNVLGRGGREISRDKRQPEQEKRREISDVRRRERGICKDVDEYAQGKTGHREKLPDAKMIERESRERGRDMQRRERLQEGLKRSSEVQGISFLEFKRMRANAK